MTALVVDAFEFCRQGERREGEIAVADLPRLAKEVADTSGTLQWSLQGGHNQYEHLRLVMSVAGSVLLTCQRCLKPFSFELDSEVVLILAPDETSADEMDALLSDEDVDVVVGSRHLNVVELIEDDALLALPLAPKHETCPDQLRIPGQVDGEKLSPFSVLRDLKK